MTKLSPYEMDRGQEAGVKRIESTTCGTPCIAADEIGFSALAIANRSGHESVDITYKYAHLLFLKRQEMAQKLDMGERRDEDGTGTRQALAEQGEVAFRMSPEEDEVLGKQSKMLGLTKRLYHPANNDREMRPVVNGKGLQSPARPDEADLSRNCSSWPWMKSSADLLETLQMVALTLNGLGRNANDGQ